MTRPLPSRVRKNIADAWTRWTKPRPAKAPPPGLEWLANLTIAILAIAAAAYLLDYDSVTWAAGLPTPAAEFAHAVTDFGKSGWELFPAGAIILLLLAGDWDRVDRLTRLAWSEIGALLIFLFVAVAGAGIAANIVKNFVGRVRPPLFETSGAFGFKPFVFDYVYQSFPSGHATTCGAVSMVGAIVFPKWRWPIVVAAAALASTRVMVGAHYPSDVVGGFLFGAVFAYGAARYFARRRYGLAFASDGRVVPRTGAIRRLVAGKSGWQSAWRGLVDAIRPT